MYVNEIAAIKYGLEETILLQNFFFWINHNIKNKINQKDGKFWTFTSIDKLLKKYPFLSTGKIRSALETLLKIGILVKGNYNKNLYNKTSWYAFKDDNIFNEIRILLDEEKEIKEIKIKETPTPPTQDSKVVPSEKSNRGSSEECQKATKQELFVENNPSDSPKNKEDVCDSDKSICKFNKSIKINKANINNKLSLENSPPKEISHEQKKALTGELLKREITQFQVYG